jgi:ketosteroid isomerase-like protein
MRYFACLLLASGLCAGMLSSADQPKFSPEQQEVIDAHNAAREAARKRDFAAWAPYVAEDCIFSTDDGNIKTKAQIIELGRNLPFEYDHSGNQRDFVVHLYGSTAVLNLRFTTHEQFTDIDIITEMRATETFVKQNGSWLLVARQWGALPMNFHKPIAADSGTYKDYIGQFEWRPGMVDTISVKDGKLWSKMAEDEGAEENLPLGPETFFVLDDLGTITFVRDAHGQVTGYTYHRVDGQEIHARKVK